MYFFSVVSEDGTDQKQIFFEDMSLDRQDKFVAVGDTTTFDGYLLLFVGQTTKQSSKLMWKKPENKRLHSLTSWRKIFAANQESADENFIKRNGRPRMPLQENERLVLTVL